MKPIAIQGSSQVTLTLISGQTVKSAVLEPGVYHCFSNDECAIAVGPGAVDVSADTGYTIPANVIVPVLVRAGDRVSVISNAEVPTKFRLHKVG